MAPFITHAWYSISHNYRFRLSDIARKSRFCYTTTRAWQTDGRSDFRISRFCRDALCCCAMLQRVKNSKNTVYN